MKLSSSADVYSFSQSNKNILPTTRFLWFDDNIGGDNFIVSISPSIASNYFFFTGHMYVNFGDEISGNPSTHALVGGKYLTLYKSDTY